MKKNIPFIIFLLTTIIASAQKKELSYEQIFKDSPSNIFKPLPDIIRWIDDDHYLEKKDQNGKPVYVSVEAKTGKAIAYKFSEPAEKIKYDTPVNALNVTPSPNGKWIAYTKANNLYAKEISTGKEIQFTNDGNEDIYNGYAAWVYYEEILHRQSNYKAFWWSPDSKHIAFIHFDETNVPVFSIYHSDGQHGSFEKKHYPQAGDNNPKVKMGIVSTENTKTVWADFNENDDQYFPTPYWVPDGSALWVQWIPRIQNQLKIFSVDVNNGSKKEVYNEQQSTWVNEKYPFFLNNGKQFILYSDKTGWNHLYLYNMDGTLVNQITQGNFTVSSIVQTDEKNKVIYFLARKENSARIDFYKIGFDGKNLTRLSSGDYCHDNILPSPNAKYFIDTYSNITTPSEMALINSDGKLVRKPGDSKGSEFEKYDLAKEELIRVKSRDGLFDLPMTVIYPLHFDSTKKYPVSIEIYGAPDFGKVYDRWSADLRSQWWAREGIIQVEMDNRGSGHFGKAGMNYSYKQMGKYEIEDYIDCAKWLRKQTFTDTTKICITGFSFGGFITCMALTYGADVFTHGIAYYPVTDWRLYDTYYTEKYLSTPQTNADGYANSSPITYAKNYKGLLRIVHGDIDNNVHMQNTLQFINRLEDLNKHFEMMIYPGERHGRSHWSEPKRNQSRKEDYLFIYKNLLNKPMPDVFLQ